MGAMVSVSPAHQAKVRPAGRLRLLTASYISPDSPGAMEPRTSQSISTSASVGMSWMSSEVGTSTMMWPRVQIGRASCRERVEEGGGDGGGEEGQEGGRRQREQDSKR